MKVTVKNIDKNLVEAVNIHNSEYAKKEVVKLVFDALKDSDRDFDFEGSKLLEADHKNEETIYWTIDYIENETVILSC